MFKKIIAVLGATASGKSQVALALAKKYNGFLISADSRQVYKRLDIGTAKPTKADQALAAVHLIDLIEPGRHPRNA